MNDILVLLINLDRSPERLETSSAALAAADVNFERISGVDGAQIDLNALPNFDAARARRAMGRVLTAGEVGCYLSHLAAISRFLETDAAQCLVLEDDFEVQPGAFETVAGLPGCLAGTNWDVAHLSQPAKKHFKIRPSTLPVEIHRAFYTKPTPSAALFF